LVPKLVSTMISKRCPQNGQMIDSETSIAPSYS
jgi:hypothetical protein